MTARATIRQSDIERAIRAARRMGCPVVELWDGAVRIPLDDSAAPPLPSDDDTNPADLVDP